jgi:16S rRNA processing protein RimM
MDINSCYTIGFVSRTHGLKGEVTIIFNEASPSLDTLKSVFIGRKEDLVPYFIERYSDRGDKSFVKFEDVDRQEQAQLLKGCKLYLPKSARPKAEKGDFYDDEVIGYAVEDRKVGFLGNIAEVLLMGPNRMLSVRNGEKETLIPVNGPFIQRINKAKKKFEVELPDGFLEI